MSGVFLRHPDLPDEQWIEVPAESRAHYSPAGWQLVPDDEVAARAAVAAHVVASAEAQMAGLPMPPEPVLPEPPQAAKAEPAGPGPVRDQTPALDAATNAAPAAPKTRSK